MDRKGRYAGDFIVELEAKTFFFKLEIISSSVISGVKEYLLKLWKTFLARTQKNLLALVLERSLSLEWLYNTCLDWNGTSIYRYCFQARVIANSRKLRFMTGILFWVDFGTKVSTHIRTTSVISWKIIEWFMDEKQAAPKGKAERNFLSPSQSAKM